MIQLSTIQRCAKILIEKDALYIKNFANKDNAALLPIFIPYLALFSCGAEKWYKNINKQSVFSDDIRIKKLYDEIRQSIKYFDDSLDNLSNRLWIEYKKSDSYFASQLNDLAHLLNVKHYNIGMIRVGETFCSNTILCASYLPQYNFIKEYSQIVYEISVIAGHITAIFTRDQKKYIKSKIDFFQEDFNLDYKSPFTFNKNNLSIFCMKNRIDYVTEILDKYFVEETIFPFRIAYLEYYYLSNMIDSINTCTNCQFSINSSYSNKSFRNMMAHYGIGQGMEEIDLIDNDPLFGMTQKYFSISFFEFKKIIMQELRQLGEQFTKYISLDMTCLGNGIIIG